MSIILEKKLTRTEVLKIVLDWYTSEMCEEVFQDESGFDLEELLEIEIG